MQNETKDYDTEKWKATLETNIEDFCFKEGIYYWKKGKGILNNISCMLHQIYDENKAKTIKDLLSIPRHQFLEYGNFYGQRKKAELCWETMNDILKRHGFRMYVKPKAISQSL